MSKFYVHVVGSHDDTFVGPFLDEPFTREYADRVGQRGFVTCVLTEEEYQENLRAFGPAHTEEPLL